MDSHYSFGEKLLYKNAHAVESRAALMPLVLILTGNWLTLTRPKSVGNGVGEDMHKKYITAANH